MVICSLIPFQSMPLQIQEVIFKIQFKSFLLKVKSTGYMQQQFPKLKNHNLVSRVIACKLLTKKCELCLLTRKKQLITQEQLQQNFLQIL